MLEKAINFCFFKLNTYTRKTFNYVVLGINKKGNKIAVSLTEVKNAGPRGYKLLANQLET